MREIIQELISEFYKEELPTIIERKVEIPELPRGIRKALVFIGMRRVGKTYLMYQHMHNLLAKGLEKHKLLYINFEDDRLSLFSAAEFQTLMEVYFQMFPENSDGKNVVFYFDEIQNILGWEKFIRRLIDKEKMSILITGSSAKALSREIATSLRGRCLEQEVFPLSFIEYLAYFQIRNYKHLTSKEKVIIKHYCSRYLRRGGFPETLEESEGLQNRTIQSYVNSAVFRDVIDRHRLNNPHIVKLFLIHCLQNIAAPLSVTKVYKAFKSRGETLSRSHLYAYLDYFEDAYLIFSVEIYELSTRKRQVNPAKIYCADMGIIYTYSMKPNMEKSSSLENAVYLQLRRLNYGEIFYYKTQTGKEIDFIIQCENGELELIQVCFDITDSQTKTREVKAIVEAAEETGLKKGIIITFDSAAKLNQGEIKIDIVPFWQWVLNKI